MMSQKSKVKANLESRVRGNMGPFAQGSLGLYVRGSLGLIATFALCSGCSGGTEPVASDVFIPPQALPAAALPSQALPVTALDPALQAPQNPAVAANPPAAGIGSSEPRSPLVPETAPAPEGMVSNSPPQSDPPTLEPAPAEIPGSVAPSPGETPGVTPNPATPPDAQPGDSVQPAAEEPAPEVPPDPAPEEASRAALEELGDWLELGAGERPTLGEQPFASVPLTSENAAEARELLTEDYFDRIRATRAGEASATKTKAKTIEAGGKKMRYRQVSMGNKPAEGWDLFISMHGGGATAADRNDGQWRNQMDLAGGYGAKNAIWVAPRAPTDEWNMWFREHLDPLFERLIQNMIAFEGVNPNRVYLNGYSAGGDGAYQMGPRMADAWAGVGMSAGHPNDASPMNLRNTPFALHMGENDGAFMRNKQARIWGERLDGLRAGDPEGYENQWQIHAGLGHWMKLKDKVSIPFLQAHERNPVVDKIVWRQAKTLRSRMYWLAVDTRDVKPRATVTASYEGQRVVVEGVSDVARLTVRVSDEMLNQDEPVEVVTEDGTLFSGLIPRTIGVLHRTLVERGDPGLVYSGEVTVTLD